MIYGLILSVKGGNAMNQSPMTPMMGNMSAGCIPLETPITNVKLATAYVPFQKYCGVLSPMDALKKGTAFEELYSPYHKDMNKGRA
jgi:hypothetical protein